MKCDLNVSEDSSMSGNIDRFSLKFRILALVVNTANLINERTTQTLSISHAILAPITFTTTYIFLVILTLGTCQRRDASDFLQIYSLVSCCSLQTSLSIVVFNDLKNRNKPINDRDVGIVLNAVLPMLTIMLLVADLIVIMFAQRGDITLPSMGTSQTDLGRSQTHSITVIPNRGGIKQDRGVDKPELTKPATEPRRLRIDESETEVNQQLLTANTTTSPEQQSSISATETPPKPETEQPPNPNKQ